MQQPEQISQTTTTTDDWTLLRQAASDMKQWSVFENLSLNNAIVIDGPHCVEEVEAVFEAVVALVPKFLDNYAQLWELSIALTQAVEQWKSEGQGGKLLVADGQEVRQFGE